MPAVRALVVWGCVAALAVHLGADSAAVGTSTPAGVLEDRSKLQGPVDHGNGAAPVTGTRSAQAPARAAAAALAAAEAAGPETTGRFLDAVPWPVIPIHMALLSDGRVLTYGSTELGLQSGQFNYEVWDPALGTGTDSHLLLPNTTGTDIFCSGQIVVPRTGEVILTGGDRTVNGVRNYSVNDVNFFDYLTNTMRKGTGMAQPRWYPTVTTLVDGSVLVTGGRDAPVETSAMATPEVYDPATGWRSLGGATSNAAYGIGNWYYPRAWSAPDGRVFVVAITGRTFIMDPVGNGSITEQALTLPAAGWWHPAVMFEPGRILSVRNAAQASVIDLNGGTPAGAATAPLSQDRIWSNATVLADGKVLVTGGSATENQAVDVAYHAEIWNPATGTWTRGASATRMRLYHSTAMLLPDGRVLTAGGGAPGPVTNLNAEIYEPPYLFKPDGSGDYADRPVITSAPLQAAWGGTMTVHMQSATPVSRVAFVRAGSVTHSFDFDQRWMQLTYAQADGVLSVQMPADAKAAPPGNYLLFVFDDAGVPSVARIVRVAAATDAYPNSITVRARATLAAGTGAMMDVRIDGELVASTEVASTTFADYRFPLPAVVPAGAKVEVVYTNNATVNGQDRNLYVESVTLNRSAVLPSANGVVFDHGSGSAAFDNLDVVPGTTDLTVNGALRFAAPGALVSTLTVRARADVAEDIGAIMQIRVNGVLAASLEIRDTGYADYSFRVPQALTPGTPVDVVFVNDGSATGDRNLHVESLTIGADTLHPTDPGVTVDIGSGDAAFDGQTVIPGQADLLWNAALRFTVPNNAAPKLTVRARATLAAGVGPLMRVLVAGIEVGSIEVKSPAYADYAFTLPSAVAPGAKVDLVFDNDGGTATEDRNLYVESVTVNGATLRPTDPGVTVDIGSGAAAFDGVMVIPGQTDILWNAAVRFTAPDASAPTLSVRARATLAAGVGPLMQVLVNGAAVGSFEVRSASYADHLFVLPSEVPAGAKVDIVFDNDGGTATEDRNLYVESLTVNGNTLLPTDPGVTIDIGSGAAAFDGVMVIAGQTDILWNAALRFTAPDSSAPRLTVRARASLAAGAGPLMQVLVGGSPVGSVEVRSTSFADYIFTLPAQVAAGAQVDIVFGNDGGTETEDRNLYVESLTVGGTTLLSTDSGVTIDIGSGAAAFDGVMVIPGQTDILWNAALRFFAP
ncbi:MAG: DUF1929 domain-containing protein [Aquabacterium sp.]|nr:MAG: DUF1929 domain-containing protein [Aquabacterium sp.]